MRKRFLFSILCLFFILFNRQSYGIETSSLEEDFHNEPKVFDFHNILSFYQPNYFLAFYHNKSPDYSMYLRRTPNSVKINHNEAKIQVSIYIPLLRRMFGTENFRMYFAYTQLFFWQVYNFKTQFIREVNYEPILWFRYHFKENMFANVLVEHQSNGKGGYMEVSWNRVIGYAEFTSENWYTQFMVWYPFEMLKANSHNRHSLPYFLGYDKIVLSYIWKDIAFSVEAQNFESGLKRGHMMASASYATTSRIKLYMQYFSGYGQSLIEYDHRTSSYGFGIALSDWQ